MRVTLKVDSVTTEQLRAGLAKLSANRPSCRFDLVAERKDSPSG